MVSPIPVNRFLLIRAYAHDPFSGSVALYASILSIPVSNCLIVLAHGLIIQADFPLLFSFVAVSVDFSVCAYKYSL